MTSPETGSASQKLFGLEGALVSGPFPAKADAALGKAPEIAGLFLFLAALASSFMTGSAVTVDGGWTAW